MLKVVTWKWNAGVHQSKSLHPHDTWSRRDGVYNFGQDIKKYPWQKITPTPSVMRMKRFRLMKRTATEAAAKAQKKAIKGRFSIARAKKFVQGNIDKKVKQAVVEFDLKMERLKDKEKNQKVKGGDGSIPSNARIIFFNGKDDPSDVGLQKQYRWIKKYWK